MELTVKINLSVEDKDRLEKSLKDWNTTSINKFLERAIIVTLDQWDWERWHSRSYLRNKGEKPQGRDFEKGEKDRISKKVVEAINKSCLSEE